jgi:hypothetical protein
MSLVYFKLLPVELAFKIFSLACFDDKATGRSLALASKSTNELVHSVRFEAVSLCGSSQIVHFSSILAKIPRNTKHLFVSGTDRDEAEEQRTLRHSKLRRMAVDYNFISESNQDNAYVEEDWFNHIILNDRELDEKEREEAAVYAAFYKIIRHVAESVQTLFTTTIYHVWSTFPHVRMPNLTDFSATDMMYTSYAFPHPFPSLRRIHTDSRCHGRDESPIDFKTNAPALEELRITSLNESSGRFIADLVDHARRMECGDKNGLLFPATLKRVLVQQCAPPYGACCGDMYMYMQHDSFTAYIHKIANHLAESEERRAGFQLVVLPMLDIPLWLNRAVSGLTYTFDDAMRDWRSVISGEKGCWDDADRVESTVTRYISSLSGRPYDPDEF